MATISIDHMPPDWRELATSIASFPTNRKGTLRLLFSYQGTVYETEFTIRKSLGSTRITNNCIALSANSESIQTSAIEKNTRAKACFKPYFGDTGYARLLQELKTILGFCFGFPSMTLSDAATWDNTGILISPFRLLRGFPLAYEPLGYKPLLNLPSFRKFLQEAPIDLLFEHNKRIKKRLQGFHPNNSVSPDIYKLPIMTFMKGISKEVEEMEAAKTASVDFDYNETLSSDVYLAALKTFYIVTSERLKAAIALREKALEDYSIDYGAADQEVDDAMEEAVLEASASKRTSVSYEDFLVADRRIIVIAHEIANVQPFEGLADDDDDNNASSVAAATVNHRKSYTRRNRKGRKTRRRT